MTTAACQKENFEGATPAGQEVDVTLDLLAPQIGTKAYGDGTTAETVYVHVYQKDANGGLTYIEPAAEGASLKTPSQSLTLSGLKAKYSTRLVTGQTYTFVFWAQADGAPYTYDPASQTVTVNYTNAAGNDENRDAFYNVLANVKIEGAYTASVQLTRPFAQLNFGASDYEEAKAAGLTVTDAQVKLTHAATSLNLLDGTTAGDETVSFARTALPSDPNATLTAGGKDYKYVAMDYVLVGKSAKTLSEVTLTLTATGAQSATPEFTYSNVPLQANYRTNIVGNLFTSPAEVQIEVTPGFGTPDNDVVENVSSIAAANEAFANGATSVNVTSVSNEDDTTIILPKTNNEVSLTLPAVPAGKTVTIKYADGASEGQKPQTLNVTATSADAITIEAPTTHVELNGVTVNTVTASTSSTTLVVGKDVKIGTLKIEQGSAVIYGSVTTVEKGANAGEVTIYVKNANALETALNNADKVVLEADLDLAKTASLVSGKSVVLDMNGKKVFNSEDLWDKPTKNDCNWSLVSVKKGDLTITGNGTLSAKENDCYAVDVQDNSSSVIIENGTFIGNIHAVYAQEGVAHVKGGRYSVQQKYPDAAKADEFVLNCYDANCKNGTAKIVVEGGEFCNFNPGDCYAEGAHTSFLKENCFVTKSENYYVVKTGADNLAAALNGAGYAEVYGPMDVDYVSVSSASSLVLGSNGVLSATEEESLRSNKKGHLKISGDGAIKVSFANAAKQVSALSVRNGGTITIDGNVRIDGGSGSKGNYAIRMVSGTVNINDGYFHSGNDANGKPSEVIYLESGFASSCVCKLNINGGIFECDGDASFLINCQDSYRKKCTITIKGGTFVGFNPANNRAEGANTNFVAAGYKSVETTYNGKQAWTVVAE
ncbi:MAG TPA: hypothetical protein DHU72_04550 [Rikenellaceae bacterium]|nr:hypothetical protein [Rikenellaceae bacterium]